MYGDGQEEEPNMERSYTQAIDDATTLATKIKPANFYTIFAYGQSFGATYMANLTTAAGAPEANNYSASNTAALQEAFAEIQSWSYLGFREPRQALSVDAAFDVMSRHHVDGIVISLPENKGE